MAASAAGAAAALASRQLLRVPGGGRPLVAAAAAAVAGLPRRGGALPAAARGARALSADAPTSTALPPAAPVPSGGAAAPPRDDLSGGAEAGSTSSGSPVAAAGSAAAPLTPAELSALSGVPVEHAGRRLRIFQQPRPATQQGRGSKTRVWMAAWEKLGDVDRWTNPLMVRTGGGGWWARGGWCRVEVAWPRSSLCFFGRGCRRQPPPSEMMQGPTLFLVLWAASSLAEH